MSETRLSCWRSPSSDEMLGLLILITLAGGGVGGYTLSTNELDQLAQRKPDDTFKLFSVLIPVSMFLVGGGCLIWALVNRAAGPALDIDADGLTDHRGVGRILWADVQSFDAEVHTVDGHPRTAKLILYVGGTPGQLRTVDVEVGGLDTDPMEIVRRAKLAWMNAASRGGGNPAG